MINHAEALEELASGLREDGLDVHVAHDAEELSVGPALRGHSAPQAVVRLGHDDLQEYLGGLQGLNAPAGHGLGLLTTLLIESLTAVHDRDSNLTTTVRLERGSRGHLGVVEDRGAAGPPTPLPDDGPYQWVAEPPVGHERSGS